MSRLTPQTQIKELGRKSNANRIHHGRLAEDYDGIGQYVMISLARSSVASAYKAHIAAGDYGTGQVIPTGTPVTVLSIRGQLEIVSMGAK